ncbi:methylenetetrahydrofolate reductase [Egibacter rhizosphaerae]|uniref:Methylenetetrahydrofolate reductase n=1 Tax=Egibacter rhizosphaerae TaxID=1670831 RepID=A0A411YDH5_9ACTN|nr:methylenetetrahydrofolate reductase [Egibacter rhizosphaerae]QBI19250.1 methylenetetrahydrofolate reductase [Egibacter rhizosphaerae]
MSPETRRAIADLLENPRFEILPLKGAEAKVDALPAGTTVTVTSSPTKGLEATVELAQRLAGRGLRVVPHLSAKQMPAGRLQEFAGRLLAVGVEDVFVVGGDATEPVGDFQNGWELLEALAQLGHPFPNLGVPAYPEGHYLVDDRTLTDALLHKQEHATYMVTQLCFDADTIARWLGEVRDAGVTLPAFAGIPGVVDARRLLSISVRLGIGDSVRFLRGNRESALRLIRGGYRPDRLVKRLGTMARDGYVDLEGFHVYTFNQVAESYRWAVEAHERAEADRRRARRLRSPARRGRHTTAPPRGRVDTRPAAMSDTADGTTADQQGFGPADGPGTPESPRHTTTTRAGGRR